MLTGAVQTPATVDEVCDRLNARINEDATASQRLLWYDVRRDLLDQITGMIEALDADPARKQKVFVFPVENTDPAAVQEILQNLFPDQNYNNGRGATGNRNSTANRTSALNNRANNAAQNQGMNIGFGTTGTGRAGNTGGVTGR